jgi:hypothetical protein
MECQFCKEKWNTAQRDKILLTPHNGFLNYEGKIYLCPYCPVMERKIMIKDLEIRSKITIRLVEILKNYYNIK